MSKSKIYEMVNDGQIPYYRICGTIRFNIEEIEQWISSGCYFDNENVNLPRI
jgi:excisionase family DNA binding protein